MSIQKINFNKFRNINKESFLRKEKYNNKYFYSFMLVVAFMGVGVFVGGQYISTEAEINILPIQGNSLLQGVSTQDTNIECLEGEDCLTIKDDEVRITWNRVQGVDIENNNLYARCYRKGNCPISGSCSDEDWVASYFSGLSKDLDPGVKYCFMAYRNDDNFYTRQARTLGYSEDELEIVTDITCKADADEKCLEIHNNNEIRIRWNLVQGITPIDGTAYFYYCRDDCPVDSSWRSHDNWAEDRVRNGDKKIDIGNISVGDYYLRFSKTKYEGQPYSSRKLTIRARNLLSNSNLSSSPGTIISRPSVNPSTSQGVVSSPSAFPSAGSGAIETPSTDSSYSFSDSFLDFLKNQSSYNNRNAGGNSTGGNTSSNNSGNSNYLDKLNALFIDQRVVNNSGGGGSTNGGSGGGSGDEGVLDDGEGTTGEDASADDSSTRSRCYGWKKRPSENTTAQCLINSNQNYRVKKYECVQGAYVTINGERECEIGNVGSGEYTDTKQVGILNNADNSKEAIICGNTNVDSSRRYNDANHGSVPARGFSVGSKVNYHSTEGACTASDTEDTTTDDSDYDNAQLSAGAITATNNSITIDWTKFNGYTIYSLGLPEYCTTGTNCPIGGSAGWRSINPGRAIGGPMTYSGLSSDKEYLFAVMRFSDQRWFYFIASTSGSSSSGGGVAEDTTTDDASTDDSSTDDSSNPLNSGAVTKTSTSITIDWTKSDIYSRYNLAFPYYCSTGTNCVRGGSAGWQPISYGRGAVEGPITQSGLSPGKEYTFAIMQISTSEFTYVNLSTSGSSSSGGGVVEDTTTDDASTDDSSNPLNSGAVTKTSTSITIDWTKSDIYSRYNLAFPYYCSTGTNCVRGGSAGWQYISHGRGTVEGPITQSGLSPGTEYTFAIMQISTNEFTYVDVSTSGSSSSGGGVAEDTTTDDASTDDSSNPLNSGAVTKTSTSITIDWTKSDIYSRYNLAFPYYCSTGTNCVRGGSAGWQTISYGRGAVEGPVTQSGLSPGTEYTFAIMQISTNEFTYVDISTSGSSSSGGGVAEDTTTDDASTDDSSNYSHPEAVTATSNSIIIDWKKVEGYNLSGNYSAYCSTGTNCNFVNNWVASSQGWYVIGGSSNPYPNSIRNHVTTQEGLSSNKEYKFVRRLADTGLWITVIASTT